MAWPKITLNTLDWFNITVGILKMGKTNVRPREANVGSKGHIFLMLGPILSVFKSIPSPLHIPQ